MNKLQCEIKSIISEGNLSMVSVQYQDIMLKSIIIEKQGTVPYLKTGNKINVLFKETEVVLGKFTDHAISLQNRIPCVIKNIEKGKLLSRILLTSYQDEIVSVITSHAIEHLGLSNGDKVMAMIKTNEMMLSE